MRRRPGTRRSLAALLCLALLLAATAVLSRELPTVSAARVSRRKGAAQVNERYALRHRKSRAATRPAAAGGAHSPRSAQPTQPPTPPPPPPHPTLPFPAKKWSEVVREASAAGCVTTSCPALHGFYDTHTGRCFHSYNSNTNKVPSAIDSGGGVCCRPIVIVSSRDTNCPSCAGVWGQARTDAARRAELSLLAERVTFVDGGDPLMDSLLRWPYPLPLPFTLAELAETEDRATMAVAVADRAGGGEPRLRLPLLHLRVTPIGANVSSSSSLADELAGRVVLPPVEREGLLAQETALRRRAVYLASRPPALQTHAWGDRVRTAFAGQGDYIFRALFVFPHNGTVMRDVINEDLAAGTDREVHFFHSVDPFFAAVQKAIRVFGNVTANEAMSHC